MKRKISTTLIMALGGLALLGLQACSSGQGYPYYNNGYGYNGYGYGYNQAQVYNLRPVYVQPRVVERPVYVQHPDNVEHRDNVEHHDNVEHRNYNAAVAHHDHDDNDGPRG